MIGEEKRARDIVWSEIMGFLRGVNRLPGTVIMELVWRT